MLILDGTKMRQARDAKNLSRPEVARLVGTSVDTITRAENGENDPASRVVAAIAIILDVPFESLFMKADEADPSEQVAS